MNSDGPISALRSGTSARHQTLQPRIEHALRPWCDTLALAERRKAHLIQGDLVALATGRDGDAACNEAARTALVTSAAARGGRLPSAAATAGDPASAQSS